MILSLFVVFGLIARGLADITGTNPASGTCLCINASGVNIRSTACGTVIGTANSGQCYKYAGQKQTCVLSGVSYEFFRVDYGGQVESNCNANIGCIMDVGSLSCGPYQIKEPYWIDCGRPGSGWQSCTTTMACSETCIKAYMARYGTYCAGSNPVCQDYARIHNGGPLGCRSSATVGYWDKVRACCGSASGCD